MIVAGPGIPANSQCDRPVAQWDYLPTLHDLSEAASLPGDLDGISLRPSSKRATPRTCLRDTGLVFHFPPTTPSITSYRDGDYDSCATSTPAK